MASEPAKTPGLSFISVGNSHANLLRLLDPLAKSAGHPQHRNDEIYILGAPLRWNWDHPDQNKWKAKLAQDKPWGSLLLLSLASDDETYAPKFAAEAFKANPKCQVLIHTIRPDANMDWEQPSEIRIEQHTEKVEKGVGLWTAVPHLENWLDCIKTRKTPNAPVEVAHRSTTVSHLMNLCRQVARKLRWDPKQEQFTGDDEANALLNRLRRKGYELPELT